MGGLFEDGTSSTFHYLNNEKRSITIDLRNEEEHDYQRRFCAGMALEIVTKSGTRADCVSKSHAIEVDWSKKWAEAIGQSLHYASELNLRAGTLRDKISLGKQSVLCQHPVTN